MKYKDLNPQDSYFHPWTTYRKRNRLVAILSIAFVPAMLLIGIPLGSVVGENKGMFIVFFVWAALIMIFIDYSVFWHCPRCGKSFHMDFGRYVNPMAKNCVHCKLPKWSPNGSDRQHEK